MWFVALYDTFGTDHFLSPGTWDLGSGGGGEEGGGRGRGVVPPIIFLNPLRGAPLRLSCDPLSVPSEKLMILNPAIINAASLNRFTR